MAATILSANSRQVGVSRRLVADEYLADPKSGRNDLHGMVAWVMAPVLIIAFLFDSAVR